MRTIYTNIAQLCGITHGELRKAGQEMARVETMTDAWLAVEDDKILGFRHGKRAAELTQAQRSSTLRRLRHAALLRQPYPPGLGRQP